MFYLGFWIVSGGIAQLVERLVRNEKARGSNPLTSSSESFQATARMSKSALRIHILN